MVEITLSESSGSVAYAHRVGPLLESISNRPIGGWTRGCESRGSPRNADSQASDADAIGIDPVHTEWTVVDGCQVPTLLTIRHRAPRGAEAVLIPVHRLNF